MRFLSPFNKISCAHLVFFRRFDLENQCLLSDFINCLTVVLKFLSVNVLSFKHCNLCQ